MKIKLSTPLTLEQITKAIGTKSEPIQKTFDYIATSSQKADAQTLFFALDGKHRSGEEFVRDLTRRGVFCVSRQKGTRALTHPNPRSALLALASYYKTTLKALKKTVTITGSVGKTTTKELLRSILSKRWITHANEGNLNSDIGMPLSILSAPKECEMLILELGMNHQGEIGALAECARADLGIITNIGHAHIGNLGSLENIAKEKMDLCAHNPYMPVVIANNQPLLSTLKNKIELGTHIRFSLEEVDKKSKLCHISRGETGESIRIPLLQNEIEQCLLLAITAALTLGMTPEQIQEGIGASVETEHRRRILNLSSIKVIDDTYNASPESMKAGLDFLMSLKGKRKHAVLGDMLELGSHSKALHEALGEHILALRPDYLYLFGEEVIHTHRFVLANGFPEQKVFYFGDTLNYEGLVRCLCDNLNRTDACFFKASHSVKLWRVIEGLCEVYGE